MAEFKITIDERWIPYLEAMSKVRGISMEDALSAFLVEKLDELISEGETFTGLFEGPGNLSERNEEIMYGANQDD
jgi:hypothetical protein